MARRKRKTRQDEIGETIEGFARGVNSVFEVLTGKSVAAWLREFQQPPGELPAGAPAVSEEPEMSLANAYAVLGLKSDAPLEQVKKNYRDLAMAFHSDRGGMNDEAMKLLNRAHDRIKQQRKAK